MLGIDRAALSVRLHVSLLRIAATRTTIPGEDNQSEVPDGTFRSSTLSYYRIS